MKKCCHHVAIFGNNTMKRYEELFKSKSLSPSLQPHRLYSPWNSPGQNTGVDCLPWSKEKGESFIISHLLQYLWSYQNSQLIQSVPMVPPCPSDQLTFWQPFMRSRKVGNYHRFFLPTLSCVSAELLPHISGTGVLLIKLMVFPYGLSVLCPGSKVQIFVLRIFQACMTCLL